MIDDAQLRMIVQLKDDPGYLLLCDYFQAKVDTMADGMAEDNLTSDERLQRLMEWKAARNILRDLRTYPESLGQQLNEQKKTKEPPPELRVDPKFLSRLRYQQLTETVE